MPSFFRLSGIGRHAAVGQGGQASDGRLFAQAPIRSRHPTARVQNGTTHRVDGSRQGQQIHVRHTDGQTQRVVPGTSSLAYRRSIPADGYTTRARAMTAAVVLIASMSLGNGMVATASRLYRRLPRNRLDDHVGTQGPPTRRSWIRMALPPRSGRRSVRGKSGHHRGSGLRIVHHQARRRPVELPLRLLLPLPRRHLPDDRQCQPNGGYRAEFVTGSVPGSRRWMSTHSNLDLES